MTARPPQTHTAKVLQFTCPIVGQSYRELVDADESRLGCVFGFRRAIAKKSPWLGSHWFGGRSTGVRSSLDAPQLDRSQRLLNPEVTRYLIGEGIEYSVSCRSSFAALLDHLACRSHCLFISDQWRLPGPGRRIRRTMDSGSGLAALVGHRTSRPPCFKGRPIGC